MNIYVWIFIYVVGIFLSAIWLGYSCKIGGVQDYNINNFRVAVYCLFWPLSFCFTVLVVLLRLLMIIGKNVGKE
jgi:hypothetical protein